MIGRIDRVYRNVSDGSRFILLFGRIQNGKLVIYWRGRLLLNARNLLLLGVYAKMIAAETQKGQAHTSGSAALHTDLTPANATDAHTAPVAALPVEAEPYMRHISWSIVRSFFAAQGYAMPDQADASKNGGHASALQCQATQPLCADGKRSGAELVSPHMQNMTGMSAGARTTGGSGSTAAVTDAGTSLADSTNSGIEPSVILALYETDTERAFASYWELNAQAQIPVTAAQGHSGNSDAIQAERPAFSGAFRVEHAQAVPQKAGAFATAGGATEAAGIAPPGVLAYVSSVLSAGVVCTMRTVVQASTAFDLTPVAQIDALPLDEWDTVAICL